MNTNPRKFESVKTELKRIVYGLNKLSGIFINTENVFWNKPRQFMFSTQQNVFSNHVKDYGFDIEIGEGLFSKKKRWRGMVESEPLNRDPMVQNTSRGWESNSRWHTGTARWLHGRKTPEPHRSSWFQWFSPPFLNPRAQGRREEDHELT